MKTDEHVHEWFVAWGAFRTRAGSLLVSCACGEIGYDLLPPEEVEAS